MITISNFSNEILSNCLLVYYENENVAIKKDYGYSNGDIKGYVAPNLPEVKFDFFGLVRSDKDFYKYLSEDITLDGFEFLLYRFLESLTNRTDGRFRFLTSVSRNSLKRSSEYLYTVYCQGVVVGAFLLTLPFKGVCIGSIIFKKDVN